MTIIMTVAGVNCDAKVLDNEITCRIPKNMSIPREGLPVKVAGMRVFPFLLTENRPGYLLIRRFLFHPDFDFQISINGQVHNVGTVVKVSNHYMVGIVLGILAALVAGAVLAFLVMKHLRKKKKGGLLSAVWTLARPGRGRFVICGSLSTRTSMFLLLLRMYKFSSAGLMIKKSPEIFPALMIESRLAQTAGRSSANNVEMMPVGDYRRGGCVAFQSSDTHSYIVPLLLDLLKILYLFLSCDSGVPESSQSPCWPGGLPKLGLRHRQHRPHAYPSHSSRENLHLKF